MIGPVELLLFATISALAVIASLHAWRAQQVYGYYRFFAFECLAALIGWNASRWFDDPFSIQQTVSWTILAGSTALAIHGVHLLRHVGRAERRVMEETRAVVDVGAYRYIRHPLYASLLFFGWGVFFKGLDLVSLVLAVVATAFWIATARYEERLNVTHFGAEYLEYKKRTKMFVPFVV